MIAAGFYILLTLATHAQILVVLVTTVPGDEAVCKKALESSEMAKLMEPFGGYPIHEAECAYLDSLELGSTYHAYVRQKKREVEGYWRMLRESS